MFQTEQLLYRRQYVLGPEPWQPTRFWQQQTLTDGLVLSFHQELNVEQVTDGKCSIVLLGYLLDPFNPGLNDREILTNLVRGRTFSALLKGLNVCGGRWIVLWIDGMDIRLVHDPLGTREVYYARCSQRSWCASQPHILAKLLGLPHRCDKAMTEFMESEIFRDSEKTWAGSRTSYEGIDHLLPNHYLDVTDGTVWRYWPRTPRQSVARKRIVPQACRIIQGMIEAASRRFDLALAVSAGWDSRVLLAASRAVSDRIAYFIQQFGDMTDEHRDIQTPRRLMKNLNRPFAVLPVGHTVDPTFERPFEASLAMYHSEEKKRLHYNFFTQMSGKVFVNGMIACRSSFLSQGIAGQRPMVQEFISKSVANPVSARTSKRYVDVEAWLTDELRNWYQDVVRIVEITGYDAIDLLYWEQRQGNWGAMYCSGNDIAGEILLPYNCRLLQELVLSVDEKYRREPHYTLFRNMAGEMWLATLREPVNGIPVRGVGKIKYDLNNTFTEERFRQIAGGIVNRAPSPLLSVYRKLKHSVKESI